MSHRPAVFTLVAASLALAAVGAPRPSSDLQSALDANNEQIRAALRAGDATALAALYTDDAQMLGTSGEVIHGRAAIARHMGEVLSLGVRDFALEDQEIFEGTDFAAETGRATFTNGAGTRLAVVRYMTLWKRTVDGWRIHRDLSAPVSIGAAPMTPATFRVRESQPFHALVLPMTGPYERTGEVLGRLMVELVAQELEPLGPAFGRYYDSEDDTPPTSRRFEVGIPVAAGTRASPPLEVHVIDDGLVVWAVVGGAHEAADRPWPVLEEWLPANGYAENGPAMETWLDGPKTEMRMPVRRID
jgi:AraC family transcriptional regulator